MMKMGDSNKWKNTSNREGADRWKITGSKTGQIDRYKTGVEGKSG